MQRAIHGKSLAVVFWRTLRSYNLLAVSVPTYIAQHTSQYDQLATTKGIGDLSRSELDGCSIWHSYASCGMG
eukprot:9483865-Pyramimonas_sp.AAC.1